MKALLALSVMVALTACMETPSPMVSDYNGRVVKITDQAAPLGRDYRKTAIYAKAVQTCHMDGRDDAEYQGTRPISDFQGEHIFLCI